MVHDARFMYCSYIIRTYSTIVLFETFYANEQLCSGVHALKLLLVWIRFGQYYNNRDNCDM